MTISDTAYLTFESFKNRKSRTFLTILGVGIGIGTVLFLVSLGYGLQKVLLNQITSSESLLSLDISVPETNAVILNQATLDTIRKVEHVEKISPLATFSGEVSFDSINSEATLNVANSDFFSLSGIQTVAGKVYADNETDKILVNKQFEELFNLTDDNAIGKKIHLVVVKPPADGGDVTEADYYPIPNELEISGVLDEGTSSEVFMNSRGFAIFAIDDYSFAKIKVDKDVNLETVRGSLLNMGLVVSSVSDLVDQANSIFGIVQMILGIFGIAAVIVAAISLANVMTISLLERTQDIGVMRAIGATKRDIRNLFLIESTLIGMFGGLFGIILGFLGGVIFNFILRIVAQALGGNPVDLFYTPWWFIIFIMVFATFVGLFTGVFPARRASRLNPLYALRYK